MRSHVAWALALAIAACGGKKAAKAPRHETKPPAGYVKKPRPPEPVTGHVLASVGERALGPYGARHGTGAEARGLVSWVTPAEGMGRRVVVLPLSAGGAPAGPERTIAFVPVDTTMLVVRAMGGAAPGFVVAWTTLVDRGEALWTTTVGDDGAPRSKPVEIARTNDDIVWADVVPTPSGAVCFWAEETHDANANVLTAALDTDGKVRAPSARVARGVVGWHALETAGGAGLSTVTKAGALSFQTLDAEGRARGQPIAVAKAGVSGHVEVARAGERLVFAWTDRSTDEAFVAAAAIDERGTVEPPRRVAQGRGGAALLALASGPAGTALLFESPIRRKGEYRRVHLARLAPALAIEGKPASFDSAGRAPPELAATETGFAMLAPLQTCDDGEPSCPEAPFVPTVVRTDATASIVQREELDFGGDPASLAWNFSCERDVCHVLAASGASPARIRCAEILPRVNAAPVAKKSPIPVDGPRVADVTAVLSGESVTDLAVAKIGNATLVATLTQKPDSAGNVLATRMVDANGVVSPPHVISTRALQIGGVSVAAADKPEEGAAIAWVARENGDPEVHVTRLDKRGRRTNDVQLTTTRGDASDVAIVWAGGGAFLVAWVDGRDGNGEVYATKVSTDLQRIAREERITKAPGDATDLVALGRGDLVWLAWADSRENVKDGTADVYVTAVKKHDARRAIDEVHLLSTAAHSRTPQLAASDGNVHVVWIEEPPPGSQTPGAAGYGAMWARLDEKGALLGKPTRLPVAGDGAASSVALETANGVVRAIVARANADAIALDAVTLGKSMRATPLLTLDGPPSLDVALVLDGDVLYFNDDGPAKSDKRARRARIAW